MGPAKPFPSASRIIDERCEAKARVIHQQHLEAAKCLVDNSQPMYMHVLERNCKKAEQEAEKMFQIEAENARLYARLAAIEDFDSSKVLRPSSVRTSLSSPKPGMFYAGIGGHQCVDHINLTAMSNPRSLHYHGPGAACQSRSQSRPVSVGGSDAPPLFHQGVEADEALRVNRSSGSECETSFRPAGRSHSVTSGGSSRAGWPKMAHGLHGVGSPYLAATVPLPLRSSQPWSGQLARHREAGDAGFGGWLEGSAVSSPRRCAATDGGEEAEAPLPSPSRGSTPAQQPRPEFSLLAATCTPRNASSRGSSPRKSRCSTADPYCMRLRCSSPAGSRDASPMRLIYDVDGAGPFCPRSSSESTPSQMPSHVIRKEILKSTYLVGANVQVKGSTIMAMRRSVTDVLALGSASAPSSPVRHEH